MEISAKSRAIAKANSDWASEEVAFLVHGDVQTIKPIIHESGFYLAMSWEEPEYVASYNAQIATLIKKHGLPDWVPSERVIDEGELHRLVESSHPFSEYQPESPTESKLLRRHVRLWRDGMGAEPNTFLRMPNREILVLIGQSADGTRVDQIDIRSNTWMATHILKVAT